MAFCDVSLTDTWCEGVDVDRSERDDETSRVGSVRTKCYACGLSACKACSGIVSKAEGAAARRSGDALFNYGGKRLCNDCRDQNGLPLVGSDYAEERAA